MTETEVVAAWHGALNSGDAGRLVDLSHPDVELGGPRGPARGARVLREWVARANIQLEPRRVFRRAGVVVVEEDAAWRSADSGEVTGGRTVASVFVVRDGRVTSVVRHDDLVEALRAAGLDESDEVPSDA